MFTQHTVLLGFNARLKTFNRQNFCVNSLSRLNCEDLTSVNFIAIMLIMCP